MVLPVAACGAIWDERNSRIFEDEAKEKRKMIVCILCRTFSWLFDGHQRLGPTLSCWMFDWDSIILKDHC